MLFSILDSLQKGDLLVADRHFAAAHFYWYYQQQGVEFLTRAHQCLKVSRIKRIHSYSRDDFIGSVNIGKNYRLDIRANRLNKQKAFKKLKKIQDNNLKNWDK